MDRHHSVDVNGKYCDKLENGFAGSLLFRDNAMRAVAVVFQKLNPIADFDATERQRPPWHNNEEYAFDSL